MDIHIIAGLEIAQGAIHRFGCQLYPPGHMNGLLQAGLGRKIDDGRRWYGTQVVRPDQLEKLLDDFGEVIVQTLPQHGGQKSDPLHQPFGIRIGRHTIEHRRHRRMTAGKFGTQFSQVGQLVLEVLIEHTRYPIRLILHFDVAPGIQDTFEGHRILVPGQHQLGGDLKAEGQLVLLLI